MHIFRTGGVIGLMIGVAMVASGCGSAEKTVAYCFALDETTTIVITPQGEKFSGPTGEDVFYDMVTLQDGEGEQETLGEIRDNTFFYADGSGWEFSAQEVVGKGGLIEGMTGKAISCP